MNLKYYIEKTNFLSKPEIEKVKLYAFFNIIKREQFEFTIGDVCEFFNSIGLHKPNKSRLRKNIKKSHSFICSKEGFYSLHLNEITKLKKEYDFKQNDEQIVTIDYVLPAALYQNTRTYIRRLAEQINCSYENNIFDGCAVLMRRLLEVLLIHAYENLNIESSIKDSSKNYKMLSSICDDAKINSTLSLSRDTKECLDDFRTLGNFSAHKIYYTAKKRDISNIVVKYRATIEELLYKSNLMK